MRNAVVVLFICAMVLSAEGGQVRIFAGARFDSNAWGKLQEFDVKTLSKGRALEAHVGHLVELHFQFRSKELRHLKPNWYQASVWQPSPEERRGFVSVPVMVANMDLKGFEAFTTDHRATADVKVYGQILYDFGINYTFVRVIGINSFVDGDGYVNVTW